MTTPNRDTFGNPVEAFYKLKRDYDRWWRASKRDEAHPRPWPKELEPKDAPVFAHNELVIPRPPEEVFAALTDAGRWPTYYPNAANVKLPDGKTHLEPWLRFTWSTFGTTQKSAVAEFEPNQALAWTADSFGTHAYHRWILEPADGGTRVVTEETQTGPTASLDRLLMNPGLHAAHELWLHRLREALCPEGL